MSVGATATALDLRLDRLRAAAEKRGLDAVVATSDASIAYLTGFEALQLERLFAVVARCDGGGALVDADQERRHRAASTSAATTCESGSASGCHCTPSANRSPGSSSASGSSSSSAQPVIWRPSPTRSIP